VKIVAITINSAWAAYNFRLNLARAIKASGDRVIFIAPDDGNYYKKIATEFEIYHINLDASGINPIKDMKLMVELYNLYKKLSIDVVLNFSIKPNIYSAIVSKLTGVKAINNITGLGTIFIKKSIITTIAKMLYKIALSSASKVFFQNSDDKELFIDMGLVNPAKIDLLPGSGVDTTRFVPKDMPKSDKLRFLMIARVLRDKGIYEYIEAIKIIKSQYSDVSFLLIGEIGVANKTAISKDEVDKWVDESLIEYLGTTDKIEEYIASADCVVLPSYREGTPRSLLEAAAMAKPIVTTDTVGCKEVVDDGYNGYLCELKSAKDLATKIEQIIELSAQDRSKMGQNGRAKIIAQFDERIVIKKYIDAISDI
jgi:glycosyltransferase involved in cell wall biosynthesis